MRECKRHMNFSLKTGIFFFFFQFQKLLVADFSSTLGPWGLAGKLKETQAHKPLALPGIWSALA